MPPTRIPTLAFHGVNDLPDDYTGVSTAAFRAIVDALADRYRFIDDAAFIARSGLAADGEPLIHVTFDDAYADIVDELVRMRDEHGFTATLYVIPDYVGRWNEWNAKCGYRSRHADRRQLEALAQAGFRIGDHTLGHQNLLKFDEEELRGRFAESRALFAGMDLAPLSVAYPFGQHDARTIRVARDFYSLGFSTETKSTVNDFSEQPLKLRRIVVSRACAVESLLGRLRDY